MQYSALKTYAFPLDKSGDKPFGRLADLLLDNTDNNGDTEKTPGADNAPPYHDPRTPAEMIDQLAREYVFNHPGVGYPAAVEIVLEHRPYLARAYAQEHGSQPRVYTEEAHPENDPAAEAHEKAMALIDREPGLGYSAAAARVLRENPDLAERWGNYASNGS